MNPEIQKYVSDQRQAGVSDSEITNQLKASGWDEASIKGEMSGSPRRSHKALYWVLGVLAVLFVLAGIAYSYLKPGIKLIQGVYNLQDEIKAGNVWHRDFVLVDDVAKDDVITEGIPVKKSDVKSFIQNAYGFSPVLPEDNVIAGLYWGDVSYDSTLIPKGVIVPLGYFDEKEPLTWVIVADEKSEALQKIPPTVRENAPAGFTEFTTASGSMRIFFKKGDVYVTLAELKPSSFSWSDMEKLANSFQ